MTNLQPAALSRRQALKTLLAAYAALAVPIVVPELGLDLAIGIDQDKLGKALSITPGSMVKTQDSDGAYRLELSVSCDEGALWQAVYATDQHGREWTTPDGVTWSCGRHSFTLEEA